MITTIHKGTAHGVITAPPSKSFAHRQLIAAALSGEECQVSNLELSDDITATLECLKALGRRFRLSDGTITFEPGNPVTANAGPGNANKTNSGTPNTVKAYTSTENTGRAGKIVMPCRESGTTLRFFIPIALALGGDFLFEGTPRLIERGIKIYEDLFREQGVVFNYGTDSIGISGKLKSGTFRVDATVSSQFISGLLYAMPLIEGRSYIKLKGRTESRMYIEMTLRTLEQYGICLSDYTENSIAIRGKQKYMAVDSRVEGDYSNAAFFAALNLMGGNVTIEGLSDESIQGDRRYIEFFRKLKEGTPQIDISDQIDLGPILFAMAAYLNGAAITGTRRLAIKESDRVKDMLFELSKFGVESQVGENHVEIKKCRLHKPAEPLHGHNDHRIVMSLAVLLTAFGGSIEGSEAVNKSFPSFFEKLEKTGIKVENYA